MTATSRKRTEEDIGSLLSGGGKVGALMRAHDWSRSPLGPPESWPEPLRLATGLLLNSIFPMFVAWGPELGFLYNDAYGEILGAKHPAALGARFHDIWTEIWRDLSPLIDAAMAGRAIYREDLPLIMNRHGFDEQTWFTFSYSPVLTETGAVGGMFCVVAETTQQVRARQRQNFRLALEQRLRDLSDPKAVMAAATEALGREIGACRVGYGEIDPACETVTVQRSWSAEGKPDFTGSYPLDAFDIAIMAEVMAGRNLVIDDAVNDPRVIHSAPVFAEFGSRAVVVVPLIKEGRFTAVLYVHDDEPRRWGSDVDLIAEVADRTWGALERARAEAELRDSAERLRLATEAAEIGLWDVDEVAGTLFWPPHVKAMFGISPDVPVSMADFYSGLHPDDRERVSEAYAAAADPARRALYDVEYRTIGKEDGIVRWVAAKGSGVFDDRNCCLRVIGTAIDITRRKADELRLRELNESLERQVALALAERKLLADIVGDTDVLIHVADRDYNWLAVNKAAAREFSRAFGVREPKAGDNMLAMLEDRPEQRAAFESRWSRALAGEEYVETSEINEATGARRNYEMRFRVLKDSSGNLIGAYQFVQDVTERLNEQARLREAEAAVMQLQKMEAVGRLTGGIAHDFNNLLGAIVGSLDLIRRKPEDIDRVKRFAAAGLEAAERGAKLTGQLLAFSRSQRIELKPVPIVELVSGLRELLARTLGPQIRLRFALEDPGAPVLSDPTQLEMAVLNLAINSRDAMPDGGDLTISTAVRRIGPDADLPAGDYVELSVSDTGLGMTADVLAKAFDPFFTTKGIGEGTGLGLSQVYGIARQAGGIARIESAAGRGTTVRVYLPLMSSAQAIGADGGTAPEAAHAATRTAKVLLIDDDPDLRMVIAATIEALGYRVIAAADGAAGLASLAEHAPDLVVVDFAMPGMNGAEFAIAARELNPGLPIIFASGYAETAAIEKAVGPDAIVLRKPFRMGELETAIADALTP